MNDRFQVQNCRVGDSMASSKHFLSLILLSLSLLIALRIKTVGMQQKFLHSSLSCQWSAFTTYSNIFTARYPYIMLFMTSQIYY